MIAKEAADGVIHLWMVDFSGITDKSLLGRYDEILTLDEEVRRNRFLFDNDRLRYLVTRAVVRIVLSRYVDLPPKSWIFAADTYGRPHILNEEAKAARLSFNISHTESLILLGVSSGMVVGVDIENRRRRPAPLEVADRYFAVEEVRELRALPLECQQDRFFDYWTLKEAYIKARGMGLSIPLNSFHFTFPTERGIALHQDQFPGNEAGRWRFWQFNPSDEYVAAVCVQSCFTEPAALVKRLVPLATEAPFEAIALQLGYKAN
jgi:4'-phosphopantetheinyl transferase